MAMAINELTDVRYEVDAGLAWITIDRPERLNAFRNRTVAELTVAADVARFGQVGPRVGSFDAAEGTAVLARVVGEKRAREIWYLCELYDAETAERWGLVNRVVPAADLRSEVRAWADKLLHKSPTALRNLKHSFNANGASVTGFLPYDALEAYRATEEAREGARAFAEKRAPDFSR